MYLYMACTYSPAERSLSSSDSLLPVEELPLLLWSLAGDAGFYTNFKNLILYRFTNKN